MADTPLDRPFRVDMSPMRRRRLAMEVTQGELARRCGVHRVTIWRIERGRHDPTLSLLVAMARALGTPYHQLFSVEDAA